MKQWLLVTLAFATGLGGSWFYLGQHLASEPISPTLLSIDAGCDLGKGSCLLRSTDGLGASVALSPLPIPLMSPVDLKLDIRHQSREPVRSATVVIEGVSMFMGFQSSKLVVSRSHLEGQFSLPVCSSTTMHWQATIDIQTDKQLFRAHLPFMTER